MDKSAGVNEGQIQNAVRPLEEKGVIIISVGLGEEADEEQLGAVTNNPDNIIKAPKTIDSSTIGESIMEKATKGTDLLFRSIQRVKRMLSKK